MNNLIYSLRNSFKADTLEELYDSTKNIYLYLDEHFNYSDGTFKGVSNSKGNSFLEELKILDNEYLAKNQNNERYPYYISKNISDILESTTFPLSDKDLEGYLTEVLLFFEDISEDISSGIIMNLPKVSSGNKVISIKDWM